MSRLFSKLFPWQERLKLSPYPKGKSLAFTIIDDTDGATLESTRPIYDFLDDLGIKATKTVWMHKSKSHILDARHYGDTAERKDYVNYLKHLQKKGFEIALHNVSSNSNQRQDIINGIENFKEVFGHYPKINVHHEKNLENLYFDIAHDTNLLPHPFCSSLFRHLYNLLARIKMALFKNTSTQAIPARLSGDKEGSPYFWGDICKQKIKYVRTNIFLDDLNTLKCSPRIPYALSQTPYVNYWFDSTNGQDVKTFNKILTPYNIRRLEDEKGCCILYTHFGKGFTSKVNDSFELNDDTKQRLMYIATRGDVWFATVSEILDRLLAIRKLRYYSDQIVTALKNDNQQEICDITLWTKPFRKYYTISGSVLAADDKGRIVIPSLKKSETVLLSEQIPLPYNSYWYHQGIPNTILDFHKILQKHLGKFSTK